MKIYKYYLKKSDRLFALTRYKDLSDEFELVYDMNKFYKMIDECEDERLYKDTNIHKKMWLYTLNSKGSTYNVDDDKSIAVCMTEDMHDAINKACNNIRYTFKSLYITCLKMKETEDFPIDDKYLSALYSIGNDEKHIFVDTYRIWTDLFGDMIKFVDHDNAEDTSIAASRLLGIYKYNNQNIEEGDDEILYYS